MSGTATSGALSACRYGLPTPYGWWEIASRFVRFERTSRRNVTGAMRLPPGMRSPYGAVPAVTAKLSWCTDLIPADPALTSDRKIPGLVATHLPWLRTYCGVKYVARFGSFQICQ